MKLIKKSILNLIILLTLLFLYCGKKQEVIKVGWIGVLSGEYAFYGKEVQEGTEVALKEVNEELNKKNLKVQVIYEDDRLTPRLGINAFNKLVDVDKVPVVIQATGSSVMLACAPIAKRKRIVYISPTCGNPKIKYAGDYIFRNFPSDDYQGKVLAKFARKHLDAKRGATLYINNDHGVSIKEVIKKEFSRLGGEIFIEEAFAVGAREYRSQLEKIKSTRPDIIFLPCHSTEGGLAVKFAKELGINIPIITTDGAYSPDFLDIAGNAAEGVYVTNLSWDVNDSTKIVRNFVAKYRDRFDKDPTAYAAAGYDCMGIIGHVFMKGEQSSDKIKNILYKIVNFNGVTGNISFDQFGEVELPYDIFKVRENKFNKIVTF